MAIVVGTPVERGLGMPLGDRLYAVCLGTKIDKANEYNGPRREKPAVYVPTEVWKATPRITSSLWAEGMRSETRTVTMDTYPLRVKCDGCGKVYNPWIHHGECPGCEQASPTQEVTVKVSEGRSMARRGYGGVS